MFRAGFFRRSSDTVAVTVAYWVFAFLSVVALIAYAVNLIITVKARQYTYETKTTYFQQETYDMPDMIFCVDHEKATMTEHSLAYDSITIDLENPAPPEGYAVESPCLELRTFSKMIILTPKSKTFKTTDVANKIHPVRFNASAPVLINYILLPSAYNTYASRKIVPEDDHIKQSNLVIRNLHTLRLANTTENINVTPQRTTTLRNDYLGYFGRYNKTLDYGLTTTVESYYMDGSAETLLLFYTPAFLVENKEILVMSIPGALSTWGGIIPIIGSIFYFFFGKGKLSPFGFLHKGILRSSINTKIDSIYRKNKGDDDDDDVLDQDHQSAAAHVFPNEKSCHNVDPSDISAVQVLGPKEEQQQVEEATEASLRKQLQHQQDELTSLRAFVQTQGDILKRLQKNELQSRNMMSLVKEFYLEMGLVDTDSIDLDNSPPVDTPNHNTTQSRSWLQGLFKSTESNKQD